MSWLSDQLSNHRLFRRVLMIYCCALVGYVTYWSFRYAYDSSLPGLEVAAVIAAIQGPTTLLLGHFLKLYSESADTK